MQHVQHDLAVNDYCVISMIQQAPIRIVAQYKGTEKK